MERTFPKKGTGLGPGIFLRDQYECGDAGEKRLKFQKHLNNSTGPLLLEIALRFSRIMHPIPISDLIQSQKLCVSEHSFK
jgi:hypothetical protein